MCFFYCAPLIRKNKLKETCGTLGIIRSMSALREIQSAQTSDAIFDDMHVGIRSYQVNHDTDTNMIPLVLVHAFPFDARMWDCCVQEIREQNSKDEYLSQIPIYAFEMPGAGKTALPIVSMSTDDRGTYPNGLDHIASAFVHALYSLGYTKALWVGISMGGYVILDIQRLFPDAVNGMGLFDSKADRDQTDQCQHRLEIATQLESHTLQADQCFDYSDSFPSQSNDSQLLVQQAEQWLTEQSPQGIAWRERMAAGRPDLYAAFDSLTVPVLLVSGDEDPSSNPTIMRPLAARIRSSIFLHLPHTGHFTVMERPLECAIALNDLYQRVSKEN